MLIEGSLRVKTVCAKPLEKTAILECALGKFVVRDEPRLNKVEDGAYDGLFDLGNIEGKHGFSDGRIFLEVCITLKKIALLSVISTSETEPEKSSVSTEKDIQQKSLLDDNNLLGDQDKALFGELWPLGNSIKLDVSLSRPMLRNQAARLEQLGYHFDSQTQTWFKPEASL